jgi:hypothetical protein
MQVYLRTKLKNPTLLSGLLYFIFQINYAFTLPFTFAITSSAIPDGAGE